MKYSFLTSGACKICIYTPLSLFVGSRGHRFQMGQMLSTHHGIAKARSPHLMEERFDIKIATTRLGKWLM